MKIDIAIAPNNHLFPFAFDGKVPFLYDVSLWQRKDASDVEEFVSNWVNNINDFPVFAFFECFDFQQEEIDNECLTHCIEYTKSKWEEGSGYYNKIKINNIVQFKVIPIYMEMEV